MEVNLSIAIITFNEEHNIADCIESVLPIADEIVVVDSGSTDKTVEIAKLKGANVIHQDFLGHVEQKNFVITQCSNTHILSLDADERLSPHLLASIKEVKNNWKFDGYEFNRLNNYCGQWIKHCGWYPDKKLRLWDSTKGKWQGQNPHDEYKIEKGKIGFLKGDLLHYSFNTVDEHKKQIDYFSDLAAKALFEKGKKVSVLTPIIKGFSKFIKSYFIKLGILDGYNGFLISRLSGGAKYKKYSKLRALWV